MAKLTFEEALDKLNRVYNVTGYSEFRMSIFIKRMFTNGAIDGETRDRLQIINSEGAFGRCVLAVIRYEDNEDNPIRLVRTYDSYGNESEYTRESIDTPKFSPLLSRNVRNYVRYEDGSIDMFLI